MIFCFSGTGNSLAVARMLSGYLGDEVVRIGSGVSCGYDLTGHRRVVWVFPVYSWGVPPAVRRFMSSVSIDGAAGVPHFMVCTCGDDGGMVASQWRKDVLSRGWKPVSAHSVIMPNTYVLLPGFDVDSPAVVRNKLKSAPKRVEEIGHAIKCCSPIDTVVRGKMAWLKTRVIYPLFMRFLTSPGPFRATSACVGCGLCEKACPMNNVNIDSGVPEWGDDCAMCLACYHVCPHHAVAYGNRTAKRGQYRLPRGFYKLSDD